MLEGYLKDHLLIFGTIVWLLYWSVTNSFETETASAGLSGKIKRFVK